MKVRADRRRLISSSGHRGADGAVEVGQIVRDEGGQIRVPGVAADLLDRVRGPGRRAATTPVGPSPPRLPGGRGSPCAKPQTLVKGKPGVRLEPAVTFEAGRKHLPIITLRRVA